VDRLAFHFNLLQFKTRQKCDLLINCSSRRQHWCSLQTNAAASQTLGLTLGRLVKPTRGTWDPLLPGHTAQHRGCASGDDGSLAQDVPMPTTAITLQSSSARHKSTERPSSLGLWREDRQAP